MSRSEECVSNSQPTCLLESPWAKTLWEVMLGASSAVRIATPFIKVGAVEFLLGALATRKCTAPLELSLLTRFRLGDFLTGSSDIDAIRILIDESSRYGVRATARAVDNLHAKAYVVDDAVAIVTSGNLTPSGVVGNAELGVLAREQSAVLGVTVWFEKLWNAASPVESTAVSQVATDLASMVATTLLDAPQPALISSVSSGVSAGARVEIAAHERAFFERRRLRSTLASTPGPSRRTILRSPPSRERASTLDPTSQPEMNVESVGASIEHEVVSMQNDTDANAGVVVIPESLTSAIRPNVASVISQLNSAEIRDRRQARKYLKALLNVDRSLASQIASECADAKYPEAFDVLDRVLTMIPIQDATNLAERMLCNPSLPLWQDGATFHQKHAGDSHWALLAKILLVEGEQDFGNANGSARVLRITRAMHRLAVLPRDQLHSLGCFDIIGRLRQSTNMHVADAARRALRRINRKISQS